MKRSLIGIIIFAGTFFIGFFIIPNFGVKQIPQESPSFEVLVIDIQNELLPPKSTPTEVTDFISEIRNLPNFEDIPEPQFKFDLVDIFENGNRYRESEVDAKPGDSWIGVYSNGDDFVLKNTKVKEVLNFKAKDPDYEDEVRLKFSSNKNPLFVLKNSSLKPGAIKSLYHRPSPDQISEKNLTIKSMAHGYREQFYLNGQTYILRLAAGTTKDGTVVNVLILETEQTRQIVTYNLYYRNDVTRYDQIGDLLWAGDLDNDGELDLYISGFGYEKGGFTSSLYLSSEAEKGKLVKLVAAFETSGC